jgi:23S rRNA pseudouridine955/2504/2580 synthase
MRLLKGVPKSHVYRILRSGEVRRNGKRVKPDARLALGDELRIPPIRTAEVARRVAPSRPLALSVIYEDDALLALDKPPGLAVHGGSGVAFGLIEQLRATRANTKFLELVHRLDRDTSGVLLIAKKRAALLALHSALREGAIDKRYLVLVKGKWRDAKRTVDLPLTKYLTGEGERRVRVEHESGRRARTIFHRRRVWPDGEPPLSLLEAELHTGRTHQIRVHLAHIGFPIVGDPVYGGRRRVPAGYPPEVADALRTFPRQALHAARLELTHPATGRAQRFEAPLPPDMQRLIDTLAADRA